MLGNELSFLGITKVFQEFDIKCLRYNNFRIEDRVSRTRASASENQKIGIEDLGFSLVYRDIGATEVIE